MEDDGFDHVDDWRYASDEPEPVEADQPDEWLDHSEED
jgi:hypothetical protein